MLKAAGHCCEQGDICRYVSFRWLQSLVSSFSSTYGMSAWQNTGSHQPSGTLGWYNYYYSFSCYPSNSCRHLDLAVLCSPEGLWKDISKSQPSCRRLCFAIEPPPSSFVLEKGGDSRPCSMPAHAGGALASGDRPWVTATRPLPATFHSFALLFLGPVITRWTVNHQCLTLRREETRQIVLTCLAGGILVLQCFMGFGPTCSPEWCAHPSSRGTVTQDLINGQMDLDLCCFQPGVIFWAGTDASKAWRGFPRGPKGF